MTGPTAAVRLLCHDRAGGYCERCGVRLGADRQLHHRRPRAMGGTARLESNLPANLGYLCMSTFNPGGCHLWVESNRTEARREGWLVPSWQRPSDVPVMYRGVLSRLHDDGSVVPIRSAVTT